MKQSTGILDVQLAILLPIVLGYILRRFKVFKEAETAALRKFVMRIGIPFLVFRNLNSADVQSIKQALPLICSFAVMTVLYSLLAAYLSPRIAAEPLQRSSLMYAIFAGNYAFLGWGVIASFFGDQALTRAVFFSVFFWPVFLVTGFWLDHQAHARHNSAEQRRFLPILVRNAGLPISAALTGLGLNIAGVPLPLVCQDFIAKFAAIAIPLILFTIGLSLRLRMPRAKLRIISYALAIRLIGGFALGLAIILVMRAIFSMDQLSQKVVLMQAVMPTATMTTFFQEHVPMDAELLAGAIACSTIASLFTFPCWYWVIQRLI